MRILVTRGLGDNLAPDSIIDSLCTTVGVGTLRGMTYLYDEGYNKKVYTLTVPYTGKIYPAELVTVHDSSLGESFVGRVVSHSVTISIENDESLIIESTLVVDRKEEV